MQNPIKSSPESILAAEVLNHFCAASTMRQILTHHRNICQILALQPTRLPDFYPKLKEKLANAWKANAIFKKLDSRANHKVYAKGYACPNTRVLIIGAGPCGLRAAIECQLLGAKVVVIEKRDRMSRNNVLHLWQFVIHDLVSLGAKNFYGKFCFGLIHHISIRQLQCLLLKICLLLGVEFHESVGFEDLLEPTVDNNTEVQGWRARVSPPDHPVSQYEFDTLIGADGKRNTLPGFKRKEFRGKLAIAITANFINKKTEMEAAVQEISGVASIYHPKFFKDLYKEKGIDLENIVYYKDETHYFVMTAKKHSLLQKGVLIRDYQETAMLLSRENVDRDALQRYALEAAHFATNDQMPTLEFALNHYGEPDVTLFDFTSMFAAENASMVLERNNRRLLCCLVGDSLLEPFWPTGSGCARGFLSAMDAAWAVRAWGQIPPPHPIDIIVERESIYRLLAQTTPENMSQNFGAYTLDPQTRYPNLNRSAVTYHRVADLYNSDNPLPLDAPELLRKKKEYHVNEEVLIGWVRRVIDKTECEGESSLAWALSPHILTELIKAYRPNVLPENTPHTHIYDIISREFNIQPMTTSPRGVVRGEVSDGRMRAYLRSLYKLLKGEVPHVPHDLDLSAFMDRSENGNHPEERRPDSSRRYRKRKIRNHQEEGRSVGTGSRSGNGARVAKLAAEISQSGRQSLTPRSNKPGDLLRSVGKIESTDWNVRSIEKKIAENRLGRPSPKQAERVPKWDREKFVARQQRLVTAADKPDEPLGELELTVKHIDQLRRDAGRPEQGTNKVARLAQEFSKRPEIQVPPPDTAVTKKSAKKTPPKPAWTPVPAKKQPLCVVCQKQVFAAESVIADGVPVHKSCFRCSVCHTSLLPGMFIVMNGLRCLHHSDSAGKRDGLVGNVEPSPEMSERITLEASDAAVAEMDEEEWAGRNLLPSETSRAGLSDESSDEDYTEAASESLGSGRASAAQHEMEEEEVVTPGVVDGLADDDDALYLTDSYEDDFSDESTSSDRDSSRLVAAREERRREVPAGRAPRLPTSSSEVDSDDESDIDTSSATEVSTDSEFDEEEIVPIKPPAITVTAPPVSRPAPLPPNPSPKPVIIQQSIIQPTVHFKVPPPPVRSHTEFALSRTRSASGIASKRALELKRKYLLGESSPIAVRRSDSASQLDSQFENFTMNISQCQALLNPAPITKTEAPAPASPLIRPKEFHFLETTKEVSEKTPTAETNEIPQVIVPTETAKPKSPTLDIEIETDSLSDSTESLTKTGPSPPVPRLEVHDASGELVQLDSLIIVSPLPEEELNVDTEGKESTEVLSPLKLDTDSSESCREGTTIALTETELSDWGADNCVLDELETDEKLERRTSARNPRVLSAPKNVLETKNVSISAHVCGREEREPVVYSNATEHFEFADEGDDVSVSAPPMRNSGYMEFVDDYRQSEDRSIDFIERASSRIECPSIPYVELCTVLPSEKTNIESSPEDAFSPSTPSDANALNGSMDDSTEMSLDTPLPHSVSFATPLTLLVNSNIPPEIATKKREINKEREEQTEVVRRLVMQRIGGNSTRKSRRARPLPAAVTPVPPPVPAPPSVPPPPARPPPPLRLMPSMSDPELTRVRRRRGIIQTVSDFFNRRVGIRKKGLMEEMRGCSCSAVMPVTRATLQLFTQEETCQTDCTSCGGQHRLTKSEPRPSRVASHHTSICYPPLNIKSKTDNTVVKKLFPPRAE